MIALRAPVAGMSMASTSSLYASTGTLGVVRYPTCRTTFFGSGVGVLKVRIRIAQPRSTRCNSIRMNLFDRLARLIKSYANALLSTFEDPEKILEQAVVEMNYDLIKLHKATAEVLASQKLLNNKYQDAQKASKEWHHKAQIAATKGNDDLACDALKREASYAKDAAVLKGQIDQQKIVVDKLVSNTKILERKIQEAKSKKDTLKARAQSAKTATMVTEMLGSVNTTGAFSAFEKMEEKVLAMEFQADALNQLTIDDLGGKSSSVDDDLAALKEEISGSQMNEEISGRPMVFSGAGSCLAPMVNCRYYQEGEDLQHFLSGGLHTPPKEEFNGWE